jgi:AraC family transcriptional regulator
MQTSSTHDYHEQCITKLITHICLNAGTTFTLNERSSHACFSKFHLLHMLKAVTGETIGDFINRIRIEKSAYFLLYNP